MGNLDFTVFAKPEAWMALLTLTFLEIVLGVDNIIFISIVSNKLPKEQGEKARKLGLLIALLFRVGMLLGISFIMKFKDPLFSAVGFNFSGRDLILLFGGLFLIFKSTKEIHAKMEEEPEEDSVAKKATASMGAVIAQIIMLDIIFSFDSILTAVGMTPEVVLMITAVIISMIIMMLFSGKIAEFIHKHPTMEMLALSFLIMIGMMLLAEGFQQHVPKGYIYTSIAFSLVVEVLNMKIRKNKKASH